MWPLQYPDVTVSIPLIMFSAASTHQKQPPARYACFMDCGVSCLGFKGEEFSCF